MAVHPAIARRLLEEPINNGNLEAVDQIMPPDAAVHILFHQPIVAGRATAASLPGPEQVKSGVTLQRQLLPDLHIEIDQFLDFGHTITAFCTLSGTGRNGRRAEYQLVAIMHFHDAKVVELWMTFDRLGMYQQLGVVEPSPELLKQAGLVPATV